MKINVLKSFNITYETLYDMSFIYVVILNCSSGGGEAAMSLYMVGRILMKCGMS
jgi:hypothetical protein